ncbi:hypothetical protein BDB00DRAFT_793574 [Zychaea mexicana]|uniref:uncharacterized protein n=1 Tax=Zychaea mexicana TaxID=64656 RepID=UPI0022FE4A0F|nr:uncharacterized protein BDB00DRAFT_793574 [Zychaea mexicana]KAI9471410.1 hypothetical protein BDB00DRAFT_793574 [Zychaea mexicana]
MERSELLYHTWGRWLAAVTVAFVGKLSAICYFIWFVKLKVGRLCVQEKLRVDSVQKLYAALATSLMHELLEKEATTAASEQPHRQSNDNWLPGSDPLIKRKAQAQAQQL